MADKISNIGLYYQKKYFNSIGFDSSDDFKNDPVTVAMVASRNQALLKKHQLHNNWFIDQPGSNSFELKSVYPGVITGIGMKHETGIKGELKLGLYFDYSSGMPCIPASSVKGALRSSFPQWNKHNKTPDEIKESKTCFIKSILENKPFEEIAFTAATRKEITAIEEEIFEGKKNGFDNKNEKNSMNKFLPVYDKDIFHDAFILNSDSKGRILADDAITNHPSPLENPNPVLFLKIISGVTIKFNFDLKPGILLVDQKLGLFKTIIATLGIGAKTNVGYGQFETATQ